VAYVEDHCSNSSIQESGDMHSRPIPIKEVWIFVMPLSLSLGVVCQCVDMCLCG
jgi:hypothetical protein